MDCLDIHYALERVLEALAGSLILGQGLADLPRLLARFALAGPGVTAFFPGRRRRAIPGDGGWVRIYLLMPCLLDLTLRWVIIDA